jgi:hypothetical protein
MAKARPPSAWISAATAFARSAAMSATATAAPSAANRLATARPMPEPPPVTMAALPASLPCEVFQSEASFSPRSSMPSDTPRVAPPSTITSSPVM